MESLKERIKDELTSHLKQLQKNGFCQNRELKTTCLSGSMLIKVTKKDANQDTGDIEKYLIVESMQGGSYSILIEKKNRRLEEKTTGTYRTIDAAIQRLKYALHEIDDI